MIDVEQYLAERRQYVEKHIEDVLPDAHMLPEGLREAMRYSVFCGGKRLRPILCLATAEAVGAPRDRALLPALAVELLHTYTLIHDDLPSMDDDTERRGKPTAHVRFGEANAILAGDALQALAFHTAARVNPPAGYPPNQISRELTRAAMCVVGGQFVDIGSNTMTVDESLVDFVHRQKTAELFKAAVRMGAIAGGASASQLEAVTAYALALGKAFQIVDDILDAGGEVEPEGAGLSCIDVYGIEGARSRAMVLTEKATEALRDFGASAAPLVAVATHMQARST